MTERIPLGEREDLHREFKGRDALKKPETIAREVVAMLNAEGGVVWVGLRDEGDRAVAVEVVPDADQERRRLRDYLVDRIEPSPASGEVGIAIVVAEGQGEILRVDVNPQKERGPYAHLKEGGRFFLVRVDDRTRPMAREEIFARKLGEERHSAIERATDRLREDREKLGKKGAELFWLGIEPVRGIEFDLQDQRLVDFLTDPAQTGNRARGWSFARLAYPPRWSKDALASDPEDLRSVEIRRNGGLRFEAPLRSLHWKGEPRELWPYILLEYPVSAFRMARRIYEGHLRSEDLVLADVALTGLRGWKLRSGSPRTWDFQDPEEFTDANDLLFEKPLVFTFSDLDSEPDRCGYRLVERVYEAFGYGRDSIPPEFDQKTGRLVFSD